MQIVRHYKALCLDAIYILLVHLTTLYSSDKVLTHLTSAWCCCVLILDYDHQYDDDDFGLCG